MLSRSQFEFVISLLGGAVRARDLDEYLKISIALMFDELRPASIAAYISIEPEEKLVLTGELGGNFDQIISGFSNFSLFVRRAIKKKTVVFIPPGEKGAPPEFPYLSVLLPLIGGDRNMGMIGMIFGSGEMQAHRANGNFYFLLSRLIGHAGLMREQTAECQRIEKANPDKMFSDRIASLGVLSSGVAHEFNNIFAVIKGYAELLAMGCEGEGALLNAARVIDEQTERGARLIEGLDVFMKGQHAKLSYQNMAEILDEVLAMQKTTLAGENIDVVVGKAQVPRALVDRDQVKEALLHVLQSSIQTLRPGVRGRIELLADCGDGRITVRVRDNGLRIDGAPDRDPVFPEGEGRPAPLPAGREGTGLKLAIASSIMQSHGGSLIIRNNDDGGKEISLVFTRVEIGDGRDTGRDSREVVFFGDTRILVVDDEEPIREFLSRVFETNGFQVIAVASGEEAMEICAFEEIDIVFLDYLMPGVKGDRAFESIKKVSPSTDIVFITGVDEIPNVGKLLDEGLTGVLKKPFKIEKILTLTNDLIYKRRGK